MDDDNDKVSEDVFFGECGEDAGVLGESVFINVFESEFSLKLFTPPLVKLEIVFELLNWILFRKIRLVIIII